MATIENISIEKARTIDLVITVTGIDDWTGLLSKLYVSSTFETTSPIISKVGNIDTENNQITFSLEYSDTSILDAKAYIYEVVVYNASKQFVRNTNKGQIEIIDVIKKDPTV